jgi:hypothetical protein
MMRMDMPIFSIYRKIMKCKILVKKLSGKAVLGGPRCRQDNNIKIDPGK